MFDTPTALAEALATFTNQINKIIQESEKRYRAEVANVEELQRQRDRMERERDRATAERNKLKAEYERLEKQRDKLKEERNTLKRERDEFKSERDRLLGESEEALKAIPALRDAEATIVNLQHEVQEWRTQAENWQQHFVRAEQEKCTLTTRIDSLLAGSNNSPSIHKAYTITNSVLPPPEPRVIRRVHTVIEVPVKDEDLDDPQLYIPKHSSPHQSISDLTKPNNKRRKEPIAQEKSESEDDELALDAEQDAYQVRPVTKTPARRKSMTTRRTPKSAKR